MWSWKVEWDILRNTVNSVRQESPNMIKQAYSNYLKIAVFNIVLGVIFLILLPELIAQGLAIVVAVITLPLWWHLFRVTIIQVFNSTNWNEFWRRQSGISLGGLAANLILVVLSLASLLL